MLELKNLNKTYNYKKSNAFQALKDINLKIDDGEMAAIMGVSGAGKSTLMHIIGCIDDFESGEYLLDGENVGVMPEYKKSVLRNSKIGIVMQDFALIEDYTVLENVEIPLYFGKRCKNKKQKAMDALKKTGIDGLAKKYVNKLSGGQKQRVAIARAIVNEPSVILADEPTGALDSRTSDEIMEVFKELNGIGNTIIVITHEKGVADKCKRIITISDGQIVQ
ncbi:MAG: ABC transporter ATP-binding protein [Lachnospiraceae bacterium]|nr:ABC transporter ATP-binding protein [Lachnospiraceae bacterium]